MGDSVNQNDPVFHTAPSAGGDSPAVLLRRLHRWRMAFFGLVILLAGMLSGAAVALLVVGHIGRQVPPPAVEAVRELLARIGPRLRLSEEQKLQMEPVLLKHVQKLDEIGQQGRSAIVEEIRALNEEMDTVLTEDQARLWHRLLEELPGPIRHMPEGLGPGSGGGRPSRGFRGGRYGPGGGAPGQGPLHVSPEAPAVPDGNAVSPH